MKLALTIGLLSTLAAGSAQAYVLRTCSGTEVKWSAETLGLRLSTTGFPVGSWRTAMDTVVSRWNDNPSDFDFTVATYADSSVALSNGQSEVWWSSDTDYSPAVTFVTYNCGSNTYSEADIIFYSSSGSPGGGYTSSTSFLDVSSYEGSLRPFHTTAMHEMGHALGLKHEADEYNIMGEDWNHIHRNGDTTRAYAGEDACDGAVDLYGIDTGEDIAVSHWKYDGDSGSDGYSDHTRTVIYDTSDVVLSSTTNLDGEKAYRVSPGDRIKVEFTYENLGSTTKSPVCGIYLSTNNYISTLDDRLGGSTPTIGRADVYTKTTTVTIPVGTALGEAWIGVVCDENYAISEITSTNNAVATPLMVE